MEMDEVVVKENPGLCRCCLSEGCYKDLASDYAWMGETEIYADMLLECFDISISQQIEGPNGATRLICEVCITRLRDACNFKKQVLESEQKFVDMIGRGEFRQKMYEVAIPKVEIIHEQDEQTEGTEIEYLDEMDFHDNDADEDEVLANLASTSRMSASPAKRMRGRPKKTAVTSKAKTKPEKKTRIVKEERKPRGPKPREGQLSSIRRRQNLQTLFNNTTIIPFKWRGRYRCFYCSKNFCDIPELRKHTLSHGKCSTEDHSIKVIKGGHNMEVKIDISDIACEICKDSFAKFDDVIVHLNTKHSLDYDPSLDSGLEEYRLVDLTCHLCAEKFTYFGYLVTHMNTVHPKRCHLCDICNQKFNKRRDLFSHMKNYHREGGYTCEYCPHKFSTLNVLRKHQLNTHLTRCNICFLKLPTGSLKLKHMELEHPEDDSLQCNNCSKEFHTKQGLKMHLRKCKSDAEIYHEACKSEMADPDGIGEDTTVLRKSVKQLKENIVTVINMSTAIPFSFYKNKFNCFFCSEDFADSDTLREHTVLAHPTCNIKSKCISKCRESKSTVKLDISSLACKICFESIEDLDALLDHLIEKHKANYDKSITTCLQPYRLIKDHMQCPHCPDQVFRFFGTLLKHINTSHTNNNIICVYCGKTFRKEQNLRVHNWRHHKEGQFTCTICGVECAMPSRLYMHMANVHGVKAAKCVKCGESFATQYLRQKHLIDAHDSGHKCSYCGKLFVRNSFMKDHVRRTHLKEKNVECPVCCMKFFNNILLRKHMVKHSGEKNFHCDVCGERFVWRKGLIRHLKRHNKNAAVALQ